MTNAEDDQSEEDVHEDPKVASSRAGKDGDDGTYVGETGPDDSFDAGESGAEARAEGGG
ncbi:hypothetical protein H7J51_14115 [Mycobacterium crocinum]|uniref:Uncharacterized protein n=2 Tax=Mycolicibacterium TaxID=1866885 RepID=A0ABX8VH67_9MYCO|nr:MULTISPECIES: hypothetical protein [Mycolicibacterium]MCV7216413.1 hypothetical protein [Mycolicibacterium crocinum]QYL17139.1 hypothetical protein K0O64_00640 [Mycolicibacterium pallens]ULN41793.1 hypothetical protein MI149_01175 [Mycolicibacterium crocinum]